MASLTEQAVRRLEAALQNLEIAVEQRLAQGAGGPDLAEDVQILTADRARLAEHLDHSEARAARLESVNREVSRRLDAVAATIRTVLADDVERS